MEVDAATSEEETAPPASPSEEEEEEEGPYAFRRKAGCIYQSVSKSNFESLISMFQISVKIAIIIVIILLRASARLNLFHYCL